MKIIKDTQKINEKNIIWLAYKVKGDLNIDDIKNANKKIKDYILTGKINKDFNLQIRGIYNNNLIYL